VEGDQYPVPVASPRSVRSDSRSRAPANRQLSQSWGRQTAAVLAACAGSWVASQRSLCADSSDRIPSWLLPVLCSNLDTGGEVSLSAAVVASWARYAEGVDEQGEPLTVVDPLRDRLMEAARRQRDDPLAFVRDHQLFGRLADDERFVAAYLPVLASLHDRGARGTLQDLAARRRITQQPEPAGR
jgi:hypothetical protein